ncbi:MAG: FAD-dependent oxidoreductase [Betaproteobacteria bacterium]|nr:MAG: FAD-dependent oxidoreductase [Betaproteobacteria bacterium]TMH07555.1 MAG: FAD-dependent oxidoreductase [Betaproteobacteria bacterium]
MPAREVDYEAIVVGAGLVGLAAAVALARAGLRVALVDRSKIEVGTLSSTEDDWDARVYAISPGSACFLRTLGVWQRVPSERIAAIETMEVFGDAGGEITFSAYELGERALAWIVENHELNAALVETMRTTPGIDCLAPDSPSAVAWSADRVELRMADDRSIAGRILVAADGVNSWVRAQAGITISPRSYGQTAIVANFATERAHRGRAFQWFLDDESVLAWLPLPGRRISIVWSAPETLATELRAMTQEALALRVAGAGKGALGRLTCITSATGFPLTFLRLPGVIGPRLALVGDAAHGVHPLAGQGVNLGFGDAAALASALAARTLVGDAGSAFLLERYALHRAAPVLAMQAVTDGLVRLFGTSFPLVKLARNGGMRVVDALGPLKRLLAQPALR